MKHGFVFVLIVLLAAPVVAAAQDAPQPHYPPGFNCATLPAGSQRDACEESQLSPKVNKDLNESKSPASGEQGTPGTVSPPTFPDEPDGESRDTGPGTEGGAGGVGN